MSYEKSTDLSVIGEPVRMDFESFFEETGRKLHLEIEPGTFLVANVGSLLCSVQDIVSTAGEEGHTFIKVISNYLFTQFVFLFLFSSIYKYIYIYFFFN